MLIPHLDTLPDLAARVGRTTLRPATVRTGRHGCLVTLGRALVVLPADPGELVADLAGYAPGWYAGAVVRVQRWGEEPELWAVVADTSTVREWGRACSQAAWLVGGPL